jgi:diadenosine tetraphosphate (Ap4A) HIT family hydrolase
MFQLHPQLRKDCLIVGRFSLCHLLLMQDANYPWFILVPDRDGVREVFQLAEQDQDQLMRESCLLARVLSERFQADKVNVAALGNLVPQLHLHHIARFHDDPAWPMPVWGKVPPRPYSNAGLARVLEKVKEPLANDLRLSV